MDPSSASPERQSDGPADPAEAPRALEAVRLDATDLRILAELRADSRRTYAEIGSLVGLSAPSVHERVRKLEARGVIRGYRAMLVPERLGYAVLAFVAVVRGMPSDWEVMAADFAAIPEIVECHHVTGGEDFLLKVRARDTHDLEQVLNTVQHCPNVTATRTFVVLSSPFSDRPVPVAVRCPPSPTRGSGG